MSGFPSIDASRLPSYRSTTVRYHPYTMVSRPHGQSTKDAPDRRVGLDLTAEESNAVRLHPLIVPQSIMNRDFSPFELDLPLVDDEHVREYEEAQAQRMSEQEAGSKVKVVAAFVDMMFALRCRYLALLAVMDFLKARQEK